MERSLSWIEESWGSTVDPSWEASTTPTSTVTGDPDSAVALPGENDSSSRTGSSRSIALGIRSGFGIFDDPDHPGEILPSVHQRHRGRVGFEGLHRYVEVYRVKRRPRPIRRIEQEGENRNRGGDREPEPAPRGGRVPGPPPFLDPRLHAGPQRIQLRLPLPGPDRRPEAEKIPHLAKRRLFRAAGGAARQVVPELLGLPRAKASLHPV